jgi:hypothetical protein
LAIVVNPNLFRHRQKEEKMEKHNLIIMEYAECLIITPKGDFLLEVNNGRPKKINEKKARALVVKRESTLFWNETKDEIKELLASK